MYVFKEDKIILYNDEKIIKLIKMISQGSGCCYLQKVEHEEEIDNLVEINLLELTESQRNTVDTTFC